jgi:hypothetical protein
MTVADGFLLFLQKSFYKMQNIQKSAAQRLQAVKTAPLLPLKSTRSPLRLQAE